MGGTQRSRVGSLLTLSFWLLAILSVCKGVKEALLDALTGLCFIAPLRGFSPPGKGPSDQGLGFLHWSPKQAHLPFCLGGRGWMKHRDASCSARTRKHQKRS
jgi:hypothetical protein